MKNNKARVATLLLFLFFSNFIKSQICWEIKAGVNMSDITRTTAKTKIGPFIGMGCYYDITSQLTLMSGIELTTKGGNNLKSDVGYSDKIKICDVSLYYLQLPINVGYKIKLKEQISILPHAGFYFAYGIWGYGELTAINFETQMIYRLYEDTWNPFQKGKWNDKSKTQLEAFKRFDYGLRFGFDTKVYRFLLHMIYEVGLNTIWKDFYPSGSSIANRNFTMGIGYQF